MVCSLGSVRDARLHDTNIQRGRSERAFEAQRVWIRSTACGASSNGGLFGCFRSMLGGCRVALISRARASRHRLCHGVQNLYISIFTFHIANNLCRLGPRTCPKFATLAMSASASMCSNKAGIHSMWPTCYLLRTKMMPPPFGAKLVGKFKDAGRIKRKGPALVAFTTELLALL